MLRDQKLQPQSSAAKTLRMVVGTRVALVNPLSYRRRGTDLVGGAWHALVLFIIELMASPVNTFSENRLLARAAYTRPAAGGSVS